MINREGKKLNAQKGNIGEDTEKYINIREYYKQEYANFNPKQADIFLKNYK